MGHPSEHSSGIDSYDVFRQNLAVAQAFTPMGAADMLALENRVRMIAGDGHLEHYKATKLYDAAVGREQHGFRAHGSCRHDRAGTARPLAGDGIMMVVTVALEASLPART